jgi:hypothetical protein
MNESQSLCESCARMREVRTPRGSRFLLCLLSQSDRCYPRYPPQPMLNCPGYAPRRDEDADEPSRVED